MVNRLVRKLGIALLAVSMIAAPVVAAQPRCCKTGTIKGSGQCCCGPKSAETAAPNCCAEKVRSCCESTEHESANPEFSPALSDAPCHCKSDGQPPAIPGEKHRGESSLEQFVAVATLAPIVDTAQQALVAHCHVQLETSGGTALHKLHCRWTV